MIVPAVETGFFSPSVHFSASNLFYIFHAILTVHESEHSAHSGCSCCDFWYLHNFYIFQHLASSGMIFSVKMVGAHHILQTLSMAHFSFCSASAPFSSFWLISTFLSFFLIIFSCNFQLLFKNLSAFYFLLIATFCASFQ